MRSKSNNRKPRPEERREAPRLEGREAGTLLRVVSAVLVALSLFVALPARAQTELVAGYDDRPARGPEQAKGAVIWNHGLLHLAEAAGDTPFVIDQLQIAGWDVFRLQRRWASDRIDLSTAALVDEARKLRAQGYRKIVTAGQSFGAWISFAAAGQAAGLFDSIVAFAPAAYGEANVSQTWTQNGARLYDLAAAVMPAHVLVFLFSGDNFDPGGRAAPLRQIFRDRQVPHAIIDKPPGFSGHTSALTHAFAHVYGPCLVAFVEAPAVAKDFSCDPYLQRTPGRGFVIPAEIKIHPAPPTALPGLAQMLGRWYGWYDNGKQVMLIVDQIGRDRALAIYATTIRARGDGQRAGWSRRKGEFDAATGTLRFTEIGHTPLEYRMRSDGQLDGTWKTADGRTTLTTVLRRVD